MASQSTKRNSTGKLYMNGKSTDICVKSQIIQLYTEGLSFKEISKQTGLTTGGCHKIVKNYIARGTLERPHVSRQPTKVTDEVLRYIEYEKSKKPSIYSREIRQHLLQDNICTNDNVPSASQIRHVIKNELGMTRKIIQPVPAETRTLAYENKLDAFMAQVLNFTPEQLHFFDEASVVRTSGNRKYGHSFEGTRAVEVQRYASNATHTVNLACGYFGIDYYDILDGPSNAMELVNFFDELMQKTNQLGNPVLAHGDCVILDNCGFHHHRYGEQLLRNMLATRNITLLFQPPYSPEFNVCEYIFHLMRNNLRENEEFTYSFTELAIVNALNKIEDSTLPKLIANCGYV